MKACIGLFVCAWERGSTFAVFPEMIKGSAGDILYVSLEIQMRIKNADQGY